MGKTTMKPKMSVAILALLAMSACALAQVAHTPSAASDLEKIAFVHGGTGPFAVAGYRIGERALRELNLPRGSFSLEVIHKTPNEVQWSCIADGAQAATGASPGKLNLKIEQAARESVETIIRDKKSNRALVFRLTPEFVKRYLDLPHEQLAEAGKQAIALRDDQIFTMTAAPQ